MTNQKCPPMEEKHNIKTEAITVALNEVFRGFFNSYQQWLRKTQKISNIGLDTMEFVRQILQMKNIMMLDT